MTAGAGYLQLNYLRILQGVHVAYEEQFHEGVNIIRGQNGSGKSTIADFIFFILGGEFDGWKDTAGHCDEVQAEIQTPRGKLDAQTTGGKIARTDSGLLRLDGRRVGELGRGLGTLSDPAASEPRELLPSDVPISADSRGAE